MPDGSFLDSADLAERIRRHFPEPGPQSGLLGVPRGSAPKFTGGRAGGPTPGPQASVPGSFRAGARAPEQPGRLDVAIPDGVIHEVIQA
jgi:hypothetical protein